MNQRNALSLQISELLIFPSVFQDHVLRNVLTYDTQPEKIRFMHTENNEKNWVYGTLRIWSPSSSPSLAAGLSSKTPATKIPTSFPPANRRPTLSPFLNFTSFMLGLKGNVSRNQQRGNCSFEVIHFLQNTYCKSDFDIMVNQVK